MYVTGLRFWNKIDRAGLRTLQSAFTSNVLACGKGVVRRVVARRVVERRIVVKRRRRIRTMGNNKIFQTELSNNAHSTELFKNDEDPSMFAWVESLMDHSVDVQVWSERWVK
jgi:hypothetical protein